MGCKKIVLTMRTYAAGEGHDRGACTCIKLVALSGNLLYNLPECRIVHAVSLLHKSLDEVNRETSQRASQAQPYPGPLVK